MMDVYLKTGEAKMYPKATVYENVLSKLFAIARQFHYAGQIVEFTNFDPFEEKVNASLVITGKVGLFSPHLLG